MNTYAVGFLDYYIDLNVRTKPHTVCVIASDKAVCLNQKAKRSCSRVISIYVLGHSLALVDLCRMPGAYIYFYINVRPDAHNAPVFHRPPDR